LINNAYNEYLKNLSTALATDLLKALTQYHRVQGSTELWRAIERVAEVVSGFGVDVRIEHIEPSASLGYIEAPVSWEPVEAEIVFKTGDRVLASYRLEEHPTLLAAHTPEGEGCESLEICGEEPCSGGAVLAQGYIYDLYLNADAKLIIYYDESRYHKAFPYIGLFITHREVQNKVVMTIPYVFASKLMNLIKVKKKSVEVCWKARVRYHERGLPVLIACRGDDPGIVFISHICHPKPGAHDNASGSVANLSTLHVLSRVGKDLSYSSCHIWVPEYTGTVFLRKILPWRPLGVVNLDMVGSKQHLTGSTAVIVNPPRFLTHNTAAALWLAVNKTFSTVESFNGTPQLSVRVGLSPYTMGSDHDVFIGWGYDTAMLNEWPSKYYHTDMDDLNSISPRAVALTGLAAALTGYILIRERGSLDNVVKAYDSALSSWYLMQALSIDFSLTYLSQNLIRKPLLSAHSEEPLLETPLTSRALYRLLGREKFIEIRRIRGAQTYLGLYAPMAEGIGIRNHLERFIAEGLFKYSKDEAEKISNAWEEIKAYLKL